MGKGVRIGTQFIAFGASPDEVKAILGVADEQEYHNFPQYPYLQWDYFSEPTLGLMFASGEYLADICCSEFGDMCLFGHTLQTLSVGDVKQLLAGEGVTCEDDGDVISGEGILLEYCGDEIELVQITDPAFAR